MECKSGNTGRINIIDTETVISDRVSTVKEELEKNINKYSQDTNKHLENIDKGLFKIRLDNNNNHEEIKHNILDCVKSICEFYNETSKDISKHNNKVFKLFHNSILEFICQCTTPLYKLVYDEMNDLHKKLRKMLMILVLLSVSSISLSIAVFLLIILG